MQEGSFRCDANVSVRRLGDAKLGTRCEIKNLNSFRFMQSAIEFEARRQIELIEDGGTVVQETRLYDPDRDETRSMRSKEDAMDYRYFPDPDLLPLEISEEWIERVRGELPELPTAMRERFVRDYALCDYDAQMLTTKKRTAILLRRSHSAFVAMPRPQRTGFSVKYSAALNEKPVSRDLIDLPGYFGNVSASQLAGLISRVLDGTINNKTARDVFAALWDGEATECRSDHRSTWPEANLGHRMRSRRSSTKCSPPTRDRSRNTAPARTRRSTRSSARR